MKYLKRKISLLVILLGIAFIPSIVNAESVEVYVNRYGENEYLTKITVDSSSTVGQLKDALINSNFDMDKYVVLNYRNIEASDSESLTSLSFLWDNNGIPSATISFAEINTTEMNYMLKTIRPDNFDTFEAIYEINYKIFNDGNYMSPSSCNDTFSKCTFIKSQWPDKPYNIAYTNVNIKYDYDEKIHKIAQKIIDDGLFKKTKFEATELESLYYYNYGGSLGNYSSEFKNQLGNTNFIVEMDTRAGGSNSPFENHEAGFTMFTYNGVLYGVKEYARIHTEHIIYIPDNSTDIKSAVEKRLKDIFGDEVYLTVKEGVGTVNECLQRDFGEDPNEYNYEDGDYVTLTVNNPKNWINYGYDIYYRVIKDSSKINNNSSFKSRDLITDISVSTDETIPLDTLVVVNHITDGETYNGLIKKLNIPEGEVFDISLKSDAQDKMITKLDNGKFLVSIPIPEKYNGKSLVVYYVSEDGKITEHTVTPKDGYATFETDHFSTYTLAVTNNTPSNNPKTADNVIYYVLLLSVSTLCLLGTKLYIKRFNK